MTIKVTTERAGGEKKKHIAKFKWDLVATAV